jgi:hypothetical protein
MIYYKIRSKDNPAMFVSGTPTYNHYDNMGRVFQKIGKLRTFLTGVMSNQHQSHKISDWEIVEIEMVVKEVKGVHEVITQKKLIELLTK